MKTPQINTSIHTEFSAENFQPILVLLQEVLEENAKLKLQIKKLNQQLEWHKRELFGKKSEKKTLATNLLARSTLTSLVKRSIALLNPSIKAN